MHYRGPFDANLLVCFGPPQLVMKSHHEISSRGVLLHIHRRLVFSGHHGGCPWKSTKKPKCRKVPKRDRNSPETLQKPQILFQTPIPTTEDPSNRSGKANSLARKKHTKHRTLGVVKRKNKKKTNQFNPSTVGPINMHVMIHVT